MEKRLTLFVAWLIAGNANALTLDEYGLTLTSSGLIDSVTGLRWLDSSLSPDNLESMQVMFDMGWRVASEEEYFYLVSRQVGTFGGGLNSELDYGDFQAVMERLTIFDYVDLPGTVHDHPNPWLCRSSASPGADCSSTTLFGGSFAFTYSDPGLGNGTDFSTFTITVARPLYDNFPSCVIDECSRSLLIREVPVPLSLLLFLSALASLRYVRALTPSAAAFP